MIDPISAISRASPGITVITSPDYLLDALTAIYVLLTLTLAIIAFRSLRQTKSSLDLTRQQIELNKQQSQEASAASERHSQATIDAVNRQIEASEAQFRQERFTEHLCWLRGTSVRKTRLFLRTDVPRSQHRSLSVSKRAAC